jgi:hypothetical protein
MCRTHGLRQTARALHITAGWLSSQLAVRRDPILFPAVLAGWIGFGQATELIRAPAAARARLLERTRSYSGRVTTAMIRAWVAQARADPELQTKVCGCPTRSKRRPRSERASAYGVLLNRMFQLEVPRSAQDVAAVQRMAECAARLLQAAGTDSAGIKPVRPDAVRKITRTQLQCLLCGEVAGAIEQERSFRATSAGSVRVVHNHLTCGRCGGSLTASDRSELYRYLGTDEPR